jgi:perosamine synthetase
MGTFEMLGFNLRLSDIQAAVGVAQMRKLEDLLAERRRIALRYSTLLAPLQDDLRIPLDDPGHTYQSYVIRILRGGNAVRNRIMDALAASDIQTRPGTHAVHRLGYYAKKYHLGADQFPNACIAEDTTITLPIFPSMREDDLETVLYVLKDALAVSR